MAKQSKKSLSNECGLDSVVASEGEGWKERRELCRSGVEWSRLEWNRVMRCGMVWCGGVEWNEAWGGVEWSGVE